MGEGSVRKNRISHALCRITRLSRFLSLAGTAVLCVGLAAVVGWPALATIQEACRALAGDENAQPASGTAIDVASGSAILREKGDLARQAAAEIVAELRAHNPFP